MIRAIWWVFAAVGLIANGITGISGGDMLVGGFLVFMGIVGFVLMVIDLRDLWRREDEKEDKKPSA